MGLVHDPKTQPNPLHYGMLQPGLAHENLRVPTSGAIIWCNVKCLNGKNIGYE